MIFGKHKMAEAQNAAKNAQMAQTQSDYDFHRRQQAAKELEALRELQNRVVSSNNQTMQGLDELQKKSMAILSKMQEKSKEYGKPNYNGGVIIEQGLMSSLGINLGNRKGR